MIYRLLALLTISFTLLNACKKSNQAQKSAEMTYCINPDELLGKQYLDSKFIENIKSINTDKKRLKNFDEMVLIKGGQFNMGGNYPKNAEGWVPTSLPQPDEKPIHPVIVSDFYMDEHEVTVRQFKQFVDATNYKTVAEYDIDWEDLKKQVPEGTPKPADDMLKAGSMVFHYVPEGTSKDRLDNWWSFEKGVSWKNPDGKNRPIEEFLDMPVTQISWYDAMAYAKWVGKRLPTEAEFEYAMRAGQKDSLYPWGSDRVQDNVKFGNFLQGEFPYKNTGEDGYITTAPVKSFKPNAYGLYDIAGNVWEWTNDWYGANYYYLLNQENKTAVNPQGPNQTMEVMTPTATNKVVRGGSFLCNDDWCSGFRNARRMRLSPDSGMQHLGFRLVRSVQ